MLVRPRLLQISHYRQLECNCDKYAVLVATTVATGKGLVVTSIARWPKTQSMLIVAMEVKFLKSSIHNCFFNISMIINKNKVFRKVFK